MALYQQLPFFNPSVPFNNPIPGGLLYGMSIIICGRVWPDAEKFEVNLQYGSDVILHVKPYYAGGSGHVVFNSLQNGVWGKEEIMNETPFPRGQSFALQILVFQDSYKIRTNGKHFSEYKHRMPLSWVDRINVNGKLDLSLIAFQYIAPPAAPGSFVVPYKSIIYGGVEPGRTIIIQGFISPQAERVSFDLRYKTGIAFGYGIRFDENAVVRNSYQDGKWGEEERSGGMPFERGQPLQLTIFCTAQNFEVISNGQKVHTFSHRFTDLKKIDVLHIRQDVELSFVYP